MIIDIAEKLDKRLNGRVAGREHFAKVCQLLANENRGTTVFLDFQNVEHITGSWINSMIGDLYKWASERQHNMFPILCNVEEEWMDEFRLIAEWNHQCYLFVEDSEQVSKSAMLIGLLESIQKRTLDIVLKKGRVTGADLERNIPEEGIKATAWNNRLKDLFKKRLLNSEKIGREKFYFTIVKEII